MSEQRRYLILPAVGLEAVANNASVGATEALVAMTARSSAKALRTHLEGVVRASASVAGRRLAATDKKFQVVDSIAENGVKLVEASPEMLAALRFESPGLRVVPEVFYRPEREIIEIRNRLAKPAATATSKKLAVTVVNAKTGKGLRGVKLVAFTDFSEATGVEATTKAGGKATLTVRGAAKYERLYAQHEIPGLWSFLKKNVATSGSLTIELLPIDLSAIDSLRHFHTVGGITAGAGVKVGVVDSGVDASHPDLQVAGGLGCVPGSPETEFGPSDSHGTHVAGIVAGRGAPPTGMSGVAPAAQVFSYRVFDDTDSSGSNFAIVRAIEQGIRDGCDLLNLSLGFDNDANTGLPVEDVAIKRAIEKAYQAGVVVLAAAGNEYRQAVTYPACDDLAIAVSAVGRKGTFPARSGETGDVVKPFGADPKNFVAAFSNVGLALDVAGAGVGVVSTVPGGYAPMSGTSMACPAVTGVLARLLSQAPDTLAMPRNADRADAIKKLLFDRAKPLGLGGIEFEGKGLPN